MSSPGEATLLLTDSTELSSFSQDLIFIFKIFTLCTFIKLSFFLELRTHNPSSIYVLPGGGATLLLTNSAKP